MLPFADAHGERGVPGYVVMIRDFPQDAIRPPSPIIFVNYSFNSDLGRILVKLVDLQEILSFPAASS